MMNNYITAYNSACNSLKNKFLKSLDCKKRGHYDYSYWVGGEIGGVLSFGDCYVSMNDIVNYFKYKLTPDEFFEWYDDNVANVETSGYSAITMKEWKKDKRNRAISWVCRKCGIKAQGEVNFLKTATGTSTWHEGKCDVCKRKNVPVTEPRDFDYPDFTPFLKRK